jgi:IS5 family transposase
MRNRFEQQYSIGQRLIKDTPINPKRKDKLQELIAAVKAIYCHPEYNQRLFEVLERHLLEDKKKTGRPGMDLWCIFVLSQVRLCLNMSYDWIYNLANNHLSIRWLMGVETEYGFKRTEFSYQNIYDNVTLLSDEMVKEINSIVLEFGHGEVFKKKETAALRLKTDSFVVESNVHFPTDYNLLWDSVRKCIDAVCVFMGKYNLPGWRKIKSWKAELKGLMRELGKATASGGKGKEQREEKTARSYINKATALYAKLEKELPQLPIVDDQDLALVVSLEYFMQLLLKHIDLVTRRIINGETIPHEEKMF